MKSDKPELVRNVEVLSLSLKACRSRHKIKMQVAVVNAVNVETKKKVKRLIGTLLTT